MTVSAVEVLSGPIATAGSATPTITTTLRASDRVVIALIKVGTAGTPSVSGLGATWTAHQSGTTTTDHFLWSASGITGGGTVTITVGSAAGDYVIWVLRSSVDQSITHHGSGKADGGVSANVSIQTADITSSDTGMYAVGAAFAVSGTLTFPHGNSLPSSGWTLDDTGSNTVSSFISRQLSASGSVRGAMSSSNAGGVAVLAGVFTDGDTGSLPPLTSTFTGWGNPIF